MQEQMGSVSMVETALKGSGTRDSQLSSLSLKGQTLGTACTKGMEQPQHSDYTTTMIKWPWVHPPMIQLAITKSPKA